MKSWLPDVWSRLRASYWFIPSVMTTAAVVLSAVIVTLDNQLGVSWMHKLSWLYANQPDGARAVLSTVAGSMITVAGVTFSMTLLAVAHASSQMGPRILSSFMRDTGNQVTLGTFIATFVYCLLILRTVRSGVPATSETDAISPFVPHLGILLGLALALASVAVLIYFVHHVPQTINVAHVIDQTGDQLLRQIDEIFPSSVGSRRDERPDGGSPSDAAALSVPRSGGAFVECSDRGYIRWIDGDALMEVAETRDLVVQILHRPGDFVSTGTAVMRVWSTDPLDDDAHSALREVLTLGAERTLAQDILFSVDQLIQVATRALSPGINDPFTAIECIHQLESGLISLADREPPAAHRFDSAGALRVIAEPTRFGGVVDRVFDAIRAYGQRDMLVTLRLLSLVERVAAASRNTEQREQLAVHAESIMASAEAAIDVPRDRERLNEARRRVDRELRRAGRVAVEHGG